MAFEKNLEYIMGHILFPLPLMLTTNGGEIKFLGLPNQWNSFLICANLPEWKHMLLYISAKVDLLELFVCKGQFFI